MNKKLLLVILLGSLLTAIFAMDSPCDYGADCEAYEGECVPKEEGCTDGYNPTKVGITQQR